jgi:hypothetical protein
LLSPLHLPQGLCLMSSQNFVLLKLGSSLELWRWNEQEMKWRRYEGGGRYEEKILGQRRGLKNP